MLVDRLRNKHQDRIVDRLSNIKAGQDSGQGEQYTSRTG
jgi:hypothetical protein